MPSKYCQRIFIPNCFYHIYNRGAHQQLLFRDSTDYFTFTDIMSHYLLHPTGIAKSTSNRYVNKERIFVDDKPAHLLLAYCLMPNHFHLMIQQISSVVLISDFMKRVCIGYAMYFNEKYNHSGTIFQGKYKNVLIENEYQWIYLSKYIHRNPQHLQRSDLCRLSEYQYSSYPNYLNFKNNKWLNTEIILSRYRKDPITEYHEFVEDGGDAGNIEKLTLDCDEEQFTKNGSL